MDVILEHTTNDGHTHHEIDLINKKHKITISNPDSEAVTTTNKRWGQQESFITGLISKEITTIEDKIQVQRKTIGDCIRYKSEDHLDITKRKLEENRERLTFLKSYKH